MSFVCLFYFETEIFFISIFPYQIDNKSIICTIVIYVCTLLSYVILFAFLVMFSIYISLSTFLKTFLSERCVVQYNTTFSVQKKSVYFLFSFCSNKANIIIAK